MKRYRFGLASVSFRKNTPEEILRAVRAAGLSCIEWGSDVHAPCADREGLARLARLQEACGVRCSSYGTYFRLGSSPLAELDGYIDAAKLLGTDVLRLWCGEKNPEAYTAGEKEALFSACRAAEKTARARGVRLCLECHGGSWTHTKEAALELMEALQSDRFGMYWQPDPFRTVAENKAYAALLAPYTAHIHVFNWEGKTHRPLAAAASAWREYLGCFSGERTLLLEFMPDDKIESLPTEAEALRRIAEDSL